MAVKIRLCRMGKNKAPFYRIVAIDGRKAQNSQYLEQIGYYDPAKQPPEVKIDNEIAIKWLKVGAQPTDTVRDLLKKSGVIAINPNEKRPAKHKVAKKAQKAGATEAKPAAKAEAKPEAKAKA